MDAMLKAKTLQDFLFQKLKRFHQFSCVWICSLLHLTPTNTVSTSDTKTQMSLMFIFYPLSAIIPPTLPSHTSHTTWWFGFQWTDTLWCPQYLQVLPFALLLLFKHLPNAAFWQQAKHFPFHRESTTKGKQKKNPTSPPSFLNKTKIASFNNSKRAKGRGDELKARVWMVALRCEQLQCCREQAGRCVHRYSWWPLSKHAELDLSLFCRITVPKLQV